METRILIKVNRKDKLMELLDYLKSREYVSSVEYFDDLIDFKNKLDEINRIAESTELANMSMDDINEEVKSYRIGE